MEDTVSRSSVDSASIGDEFVLVNAEPKLRMADGDSKDLERKMSEVLNDDSQSNGSQQPKMDEQLAEPMFAENEDMYSSYIKEPIDFTGVTYLGCATVNAPRSETEIYRNMCVLNQNTQVAIPVVLSVPANSEGTVRLLDTDCQTEIANYKIHSILFCVRGSSNSDEKRCFAFTCSHGGSPDTAIFQCHVFRCDVQESVGKILYSFGTAFRRIPKSVSRLSHSSTAEESRYQFTVVLELKEDDGKGNYVTCPKDKNIFKLRQHLEKKLIITVQQTSNRDLKIERCFGLLITPGRNVKHSDMHLVELVSMGLTGEGRGYTICGHWDPTDSNFQILNTETPKDSRVFMTIAVDLVIEGIQEPVRFIIESKARIYPTSERFWHFTKKPLVEEFVLTLKPCEDLGLPSTGKEQYDVISIESMTERTRKKASNRALPLASSAVGEDQVLTPQEPDEESDNDEPLLSGSGSVSKDVTDENLLEAWADVLTKWHHNLRQKPKQVTQLCRKGIPEALRGEVWQLLVGCDDNPDMLENYRVLITKESPSEQVILRDINRTFPGHDFFKEAGGVGQDSLYKISKAYSVYDEEIGYCQGQSFLIAALLLHMPEEQAFCVLVKIMFDYRLRELFRQDFEALHVQFYQLERILQDQLGDLHDHFLELGLEAHMYASQWFLTLFTAKFPLFMVFHILDIYLSEGTTVIFNVAVALLKTSRKDLLALDFEGVLKYFRVQLPKKYRTEEAARELLQHAISVKVSSKKLKKYEKEFFAMKEQEFQQEDPIERFERENKRLLEANMRLEQENDDLAHELVTSKIALRNDLDNAEDKCEALNKELLQTKSTLIETEDEKKRLEVESAQLKEMCRRELEKAESENSRNAAIINDYKQICTQLSDRLEKQQAASREEVKRLKAQIQSCDKCSTLLSPDGEVRKIDTNKSEDLNPRLMEKDKLIRELELELAQTKLAHVESECRVQDLTHQLNSAITEIQSSKNTWLHKTLSSIRDVTSKRENKEVKE